jgi:ABC-type branched-subunit amino acid transport system ATPase component
LAGANPIRQFAGRAGDKRAVTSSARRAAGVVGIGDLIDRPVADLSTGQRRLVELARVLAGPFDMILLDEPSSGLDHRETEHFGAILQRVVHERGVGILIVEHDMALVRQVCDSVFVLDFGREIFKGTPSEMLANDLVKAAYLGSDAPELEIQTSTNGTAVGQ